MGDQEPRWRHQKGDHVFKMDSIRKKMQSMKGEIDDMYTKISEYENQAKEADDVSDRFDCELRDTGKKVQKIETSMEEIMEKLTGSNVKMEEADKDFKEKEEDVNAQNRRVLLLEQEMTINIEKLAVTVMKLAQMS